MLPLTPTLSHQETVSQCHSEALAEESDTKCHPERSEGSAELLRFAQYKLHGVYPELKSETLRFTQGDTWRRVQNDKHAISLIVTQPPGERGIIGIIF